MGSCPTCKATREELLGPDQRDDGFTLVAGGHVDFAETAVTTPNNPRTSRDHVNSLRIITWNVRHFEGGDGAVDPVRAACAIKHVQPDLVALQEVFHPFVCDGRGSFPLREFAREMGMGLAFAKNEELRVGNGRFAGEFGNALLKRGPYDGAQNYLLTKTPAPPRPWNEQRGLLSIRFDLRFKQFFLYNTHLDPLSSHELQAAQAKEALAHIKLWNSPHVLVGDFNCLPPGDGPPEATTAVRAILEAGYVDAGWFRGDKTYPSHDPTQRIDYIFVQRGVTISRCETIDNELTRAASDHLPLFAELAL
jgi:endonuclease/exonuclease/phosphatase family metal-dependent hydrolase